MPPTSPLRTYQRHERTPLEQLVPNPLARYSPADGDAVMRGTLWPESRTQPACAESPVYLRRDAPYVEAAEATLRMCDELHIVMTKARVLAHLQAYARRCMRVRNFYMFRVTAALAKAFHVWLHWQGHWVVLIFREWRAWVRRKYEKRDLDEWERQQKRQKSEGRKSGGAHKKGKGKKRARKRKGGSSKKRKGGSKKKKAPVAAMVPLPALGSSSDETSSESESD
jgi:hypothetical protein